jgi:hypothetical protein
LGDGDSHSDSRADGSADGAGNNELHGLRTILKNEKMEEWKNEKMKEFGQMADVRRKM